MGLRRSLRRFFNRAFGIDVTRMRREHYDADGLRSVHNHDFQDGPEFLHAYERGIQAAGRDLNWRWRVHVGLWAAIHATQLKGDFVECGVNRGFLSSAIMDYLDWDSLDRTFYLFDTFQGLDKRWVSEEERAAGALARSQRILAEKRYVSNVDEVRKNFDEWKNVCLVVGAVPETLEHVEIQRVAYVHLDMNCSPPEVAAAMFFWSRLVPGGLLLLDDYGYRGFESKKAAMDDFAASKNVQVLSLPTGQGLILKPPR
jgi:hypothetical protein